MDITAFFRKKARNLLGRFRSPKPTHATHLQRATGYFEIGTKSPALEQFFDPLKDVPGWFNVDDFGHFSLVLGTQALSGIQGDLFEIGSYHGRSTAVMARHLRPGERIVVCDAFDLAIEDIATYGSNFAAPTVDDLIANIKKVSPSLDESRIVIHKCLSEGLTLDEGDRFRFTHIDGGHTPEQVFADLALAYRHTVPGGIIVMDDYHNSQWFGVTRGTDDFLAQHEDVKVIADLNRHGASGRKLYLAKL